MRLDIEPFKACKYSRDGVHMMPIPGGYSEKDILQKYERKTFCNVTCSVRENNYTHGVEDRACPVCDSPISWYTKKGVKLNPSKYLQKRTCGKFSCVRDIIERQPGKPTKVKKVKAWHVPLDAVEAFYLREAV